MRPNIAEQDTLDSISLGSMVRKSSELQYITSTQKQETWTYEQIGGNRYDFLWYKYQFVRPYNCIDRFGNCIIHQVILLSLFSVATEKLGCIIQNDKVHQLMRSQPHLHRTVLG